VPVDLGGALNGDPAANSGLQAGDKLYVEGEEQRVTVEGEVRFPGAYPIEEGLTLKALIGRAGGFTPSASLAQASVVRQVDYGSSNEEDVVLNRLLALPRSQRTIEEQAVLTMKTQQVPGRLPIDFVALFERGDEKHNISLEGDDIIRIPRFMPSVLVNGFVLAPAAIPYDSTYTLHDYIARAGGFSDRARKDHVVVVQGGTGNSVKAKKVQRISPGDAIYVPSKAPGQGWRIFRESLLVLTQIATLILIIQNTRK
jgi:protein involved in polysaccharide export with SLBB domain